MALGFRGLRCLPVELRQACDPLDHGVGKTGGAGVLHHLLEDGLGFDLLHLGLERVVLQKLFLLLGRNAFFQKLLRIDGLRGHVRRVFRQPVLVPAVLQQLPLVLVPQGGGRLGDLELFAQLVELLQGLHGGFEAFGAGVVPEALRAVPGFQTAVVVAAALGVLQQDVGAGVFRRFQLLLRETLGLLSADKIQLRVEQTQALHHIVVLRRVGLAEEEAALLLVQSAVFRGEAVPEGLRRLLLQQGLKPFRIQLHRQALQLQIFGILVVAFRHAGIDVPRDPRDGILEYGLLFRRLRVRAHGRPDLLGQAAYGEAKIHFALNRVSRVQLLFPILVLELLFQILRIQLAFRQDHAELGGAGELFPTLGVIGGNGFLKLLHQGFFLGKLLELGRVHDFDHVLGKTFQALPWGIDCRISQQLLQILQTYGRQPLVLVLRLHLALHRGPEKIQPA